MPRFSIDNSSEEDNGEGSSEPHVVKRARIGGYPTRSTNTTTTASTTDNRGAELNDDDVDGAGCRLPEDMESDGEDEEEEEEEELEEEEYEEEEGGNVVEGGGWHCTHDTRNGICRVPVRCGSAQSTEGSGGESGPISVTLTDPDVLDCPICLEPLTIPVFQCENGHTACSSCCSKLRNKCPSCCLPIGYNRCRAIEKVLESVKISCQNMKYGCKDVVSYSKKHEHEKTCIHEPCSCPYPGCDFIGSSKCLYLHFNSRHPDSAIRFSFESVFHVPIHTSRKYLILQDHADHTIFVLNYCVQSIGNVANIACIAPSSLQKGFSYELTASNGDSSVTLKSMMESTPKRTEYVPQKAFLLVPTDIMGSSRAHVFKVCIRKNKEVPVRNSSQTLTS